MGIWDLCEARQPQIKANSSAADADFVTIGYPGPGDGKLWVCISCGYMPSVAETQVISFEKRTVAGPYYLAILNPVSMALNPAHATFIEQGMEYLLLPGEYLYVRRGGHTAGSTMSGVLQVIEIDLPLYTYEEPQTVKRQRMAISSIRQRLVGGIGRGGGGPIPPVVPPGARGGGGPLAV